MGAAHKWTNPEDTVSINADATPGQPGQDAPPTRAEGGKWDGVGPEPAPLDIYGGPPHEDWGDTETMTPEELQKAIAETRAFDPPGVDTPHALGLTDDFQPGRPYTKEAGGTSNDGKTISSVHPNPAP